MTLRWMAVGVVALLQPLDALALPVVVAEFVDSSDTKVALGEATDVRIFVEGLSSIEDAAAVEIRLDAGAGYEVTAVDFVGPASSTGPCATDPLCQASWSRVFNDRSDTPDQDYFLNFFTFSTARLSSDFVYAEVTIVGNSPGAPIQIKSGVVTGGTAGSVLLGGDLLLRDGSPVTVIGEPLDDLASAPASGEIPGEEQPIDAAASPVGVVGTPLDDFDSAPTDGSIPAADDPTDATGSSVFVGQPVADGSIPAADDPTDATESPGDPAISDPDLIARVLDPHDGENAPLPEPRCAPGVEGICVLVLDGTATVPFQGAQNAIDEFFAEVKPVSGDVVWVVSLSEDSHTDFVQPSHPSGDASAPTVVATPEPDSVLLLLITLSALLAWHARRA